MAARQAPQSMGFSRQAYWSRFPWPPPEDLPNPGTKPRSPALQVDSLPCYHQYLKGISSLSHSIAFSLLLCIINIRRPYLSSLFSGILPSVGYIFPFPPCLLLLFFLQLFVKPPQITTLPSCISFSLV